MSSDEKVNPNIKEILALAESILSGEIDLLDGALQMCKLRLTLDNPENELFFPFRAVESDADEFPMGELRERFSSEYLQKMDYEMQRYRVDMKEHIDRACRDVIKAFS